MNTRSRLSFVGLALLLAVFLPATSAMADVTAAGPSAFRVGSTLITFDGLADGTEVNGLVVDGVLFNYTLGNGQVIIDGGPGVTNHIDPPNVVSIGDNTGTMILTLPAPAKMIGYGYAILDNGFVANATTISLYSGTTFLGSHSYDGNSDPIFTGGFASILSTVPFNIVHLTFNSQVAPAWAFDNVLINNSATPELGTLLLFGTGLVGLAGAIRRKMPRT